jgi:hypothetical protein
MSNITNPYHVVKMAQEMPAQLQQEMEVDLNTSLDLREIRDGRGALLDVYVDKRLRSDKPITFLEFVDDLRKLWEAAGNTAKIVRSMPLSDDAQFPTITYRILGRELNLDFKDIKPRMRGIISHPYIDGEYVELYGQIFDITVEFAVYSMGAEEADQLVLELEEFLQTYAGFFKQNGVQEILFKSQGEDEVLTTGRVGAAKRTLLYTMRFEKLIVRFLNQIEQIAVQANLQSEEEIN